MRTFFVSRHPGAIEWARRRQIQATHVTHLDPACLQAGDTVIGTLPAHLIAEACVRGARYLHLLVDMPARSRGQELSADQLEQMGAQLVGLVCSYDQAGIA